MPTVVVIYVKATYVLAIFVHIINILAVTDPIFTKLYRPNFWGALIFRPHLFKQTSLDPNMSRPKIFWIKYSYTNLFYLNSYGPVCFGPKIFCTQKFLDPKFVNPNFFLSLIFLSLIFWIDFSGPTFFEPNNFLTYIFLP